MTVTVFSALLRSGHMRELGSNVKGQRSLGCHGSLLVKRVRRVKLQSHREGLCICKALFIPDLNARLNGVCFMKLCLGPNFSPLILKTT